MIDASRRGFLKGLGALGAGLIVEPMIEPLIVVPERKIWVVGAQLERPFEIWAVGARLDSPNQRRVRFPTFEIVSVPEFLPSGLAMEYTVDRALIERFAEPIMTPKGLILPRTG